MQNIEFFQGLEKKAFEQLRDYQLSGIQEIQKHVDKGEKSILRQAFTGTGKSFEQYYLAIKHLSENPENKVLFLAHKDELIENLAKYFLKEKIFVSYIQPGKATLYNSRVYIASVDTLKNRLDKITLKPTLILADECHHSPAKSWKKILNFYDCLKIGFSATPERLDGASFNDIFKILIQGHDYRWYIENGYLAPFQFVNPGHFVDFEFKIVRGDYDLQQQSEVLDDAVIYADAVETWHKFTRGLKTVTFCSSITNSQKTAIAYNNYGFKEFGRQIAEHLDGTTDKKYRREILSRFKLPLDHPESILIICNFNLINEGVDIPDCSVTQWLRKTASEIFYDQGNGRSNRIDKNDPSKIQYIIDHVGNKLVHGYPDRVRTYDLKGRKEKEKERKYHLICGICQTRVHPDYRKLQKIAKWVDCPNCECTVPVPTLKAKRVRKEKEIDESVEMVLDACGNTDLINLQALFNKYNNLNNKRFFDKLTSFDHLNLEHFKIACQFRNVDQSFAYSAWSRKLAKLVN